jgi:ATP-binding cassette subfamily C protein LapB
VKEGEFGVYEACTALERFGFRAQLADCAIEHLPDQLCPLIAFDKSNNPFVILGVEPYGRINLLRYADRTDPERIGHARFEAFYCGVVLRVQKLSNAEWQKKKGHWFFSAFLKSQWLYWQVLLATIMTNILALSISIFTMTVYDRVIPNAAIESLIALTVGVVIALGFDFLIRYIRALFIDQASRIADYDVSVRIFDRILSLSATEYTLKKGMLAGVVREYEALREFFTSSSLVLLVDLPFALFFLYVISIIAGPLAYIGLIALPVVIVAGVVMQPFLSRFTRLSQQHAIAKQAILVETLSGLETVGVTGAGALMKTRYLAALREQLDTGASSRTCGQLLINFSMSVQQYAQVFAVVFGVFLIKNGDISQGALIAAVILGGRALAPLAQLTHALTRANAAISAYTSLNDLLHDFPLQRYRTSSISRSQLSGAIEFRDVSFKFKGESKPLISNLSFKIYAGQTVVLLGEMGSGKSTILKLIAGVLQPCSGQVLVDGVSVRQLDRQDRQQNIGVMLQDAWMFSGSIQENIQTGALRHTDADMTKLAQFWGLSGLISREQSEGIAGLSDKTAVLSGGQRQAVSLARAFVHDPSILLLDEPTSAMDPASEGHIADNLIHMRSDKTMIIVTHRSALFKAADRVLVIKQGQIVADQHPSNLMAKT